LSSAAAECSVRDGETASAAVGRETESSDRSRGACSSGGGNSATGRDLDRLPAGQRAPSRRDEAPEIDREGHRGTHVPREPQTEESARQPSVGVSLSSSVVSSGLRTVTFSPKGAHQPIKVEITEIRITK